MAGAVTSPVAYDLTVAGLPAKVHADGVTADADGFYYKAGQLVEIAGDETIKVATTAGAAIGILEDSITTKTNPNGLDDRTRVTVLPFGYRRVLRMIAEGNLTAGTRVCQGTKSKQAVKAMSDLAVAVVVEGSTTVTGDVTAAATLSGGILPEKEIGIVWKGADDGKVALILAY